MLQVSSFHHLCLYFCSQGLCIIKNEIEIYWIFVKKCIFWVFLNFYFFFLSRHNGKPASAWQDVGIYPTNYPINILFTCGIRGICIVCTVFFALVYITMKKFKKPSDDEILDPKDLDLEKSSRPANIKHQMTLFDDKAPMKKK